MINDTAHSIHGTAIWQIKQRAFESLYPVSTNSKYRLYLNTHLAHSRMIFSLILLFCQRAYIIICNIKKCCPGRVAPRLFSILPSILKVAFKATVFIKTSTSVWVPTLFSLHSLPLLFLVPPPLQFFLPLSPSVFLLHVLYYFIPWPL